MAPTPTPFALLGHEDVVSSVAFYPNPYPHGHHGGASLLPLALVSTSLDHTLRIWDMDTGLCAHTLDAGVPLYAQCRPYRGTPAGGKKEGNREACSAAAILGVGHGKYWFLWDVVSASHEETFEAVVKDTDTAAAVQHLEGLITAHGHIPHSSRALGTDHDGIRDEVDDEEEILSLIRNPKSERIGTLVEGKTTDIVDDESSDDEMALLRK
ncbi:unnamed protein product [Phytomonas sp. EM1]|nr:unnamed protein product [Phytomonas sp. EM1]|eukprot:CCW62963.1 unnamed protein product [Phytomonas sp. isolate EM1]